MTPTHLGPLRRILAPLPLAAALLLGGCGGGGEEGGSDRLRVGATPVPHAEVLEFIRPLLADEGIDLRIVTFTDYVQPNLALNGGELDANYFQTVPYLDEFNRNRGGRLVPVAQVHVEPMGLYSERFSSLAELPDRAEIAVPNDPTNTGRALLLLQSEGLARIRPEAGIDGTVLDIVGNPRNFRFRELESAQLPRSLRDVDAAVINTNYALEAGLDPAEDALLIEPPDSPYANVLVVREGNEEDPRIRRLIRILTGPEVAAFIRERYEGAVIPAGEGGAPRD